MARTKEDAIADKKAAETTATPRGRGRPPKGSSDGVKKPAYVPTGRPRGRPKGDGPPKPAYVPTGRPRGRPKGTGNAKKAAKVAAMNHARAQKGKTETVAKPSKSTGADKPSPKVAPKGRRASRKVEPIEEPEEEEQADESGNEA